MSTDDGIAWFTSHGQAPQDAQKLAYAEHAARRACYTTRWEDTWACQVLPEDVNGLITSARAIDLDAHPSADPRARDTEQRLLKAAGLDNPRSPGHNCYYLTWSRETTLRVYAPDGTLLEEYYDYVLDPDASPDEIRILTAHILTSMMACDERDQPGQQ